MKLNRLEQIIKDKLLDFKPEVDQELWIRLEDRLETVPLKVRKFSFAKYAIPAAASILLAVVSFAAFQIIRYHKNEKSIISNSNPTFLTIKFQYLFLLFLSIALLYSLSLPIPI